MTLIAILMATLAAGIGSVWLAAGLMRLGLLAQSAGVYVPAGERVGEPRWELRGLGGAAVGIAVGIGGALLARRRLAAQPVST